MSLQKPIFLKLIDNQPISDFCSASQELCFSYDWDLQISKIGSDGNPLITLEVSNDNVNWNDYHECAINVPLDEDSIRFVDDIMPSRYFRICVAANGTTTGTISALITLKSK